MVLSNSRVAATETRREDHAHRCDLACRWPASGIDARPSGAETYRPWCVVYNGRDGAYTCIFSSYEQCMMTATPGTGGSCVQNPWYAAYGPNSPGSPSTTTGQGKRAKR